MKTRIGIRLLPLFAALFVLLAPAVALAQTADTQPAELVALLFASWGKWSVCAGLGVLVLVHVWRQLKPEVWGALHPVARRLIPPAVSALTTAAIGLASGATWAEAGQVFAVQWVALAWAADVVSGGGHALVGVLSALLVKKVDQ